MKPKTLEQLEREYEFARNSFTKACFEQSADIDKWRQAYQRASDNYYKVKYEIKKDR